MKILEDVAKRVTPNHIKDGFSIVVGSALSGLTADIADADKCAALSGYGIFAEMNRQDIFIGTRKLMQEQNISIVNETELTMEKLEQDGKTAM